MSSPSTTDDAQAGARHPHALLGAGVPLTLLLDLADPRGPRSADLYDAEVPDLTWLPACP